MYIKSLIQNMAKFFFVLRKFSGIEKESVNPDLRDCTVDTLVTLDTASSSYIKILDSPLTKPFLSIIGMW